MTAKKSNKTDRVPENVGRLMRKWRQIAGLSLDQVATKIGCTKGHLSGCENGNGNLSLPLFLDFCRAIDAPASKVLGDGMLAKHRNVDRLAAEIAKNQGAADLAWLSKLTRAEYKAAMIEARERVFLMRHQNRIRPLARKASRPTRIR